MSEGKHTPAVLDVLYERRRQVEVEGWTPEHDDTHTSGELARAAASYAAEGGLFRISRLQVPLQVWPYRWEWKPSGNRRQDLVKAGALVLAEIERLDRAALAKARATQDPDTTAHVAERGPSPTSPGTTTDAE